MTPEFCRGWLPGASRAAGPEKIEPRGDPQAAIRPEGRELRGDGPGDGRGVSRGARLLADDVGGHADIAGKGRGLGGGARGG